MKDGVTASDYLPSQFLFTFYDAVGISSSHVFMDNHSPFVLEVTMYLNIFTYSNQSSPTPP